MSPPRLYLDHAATAPLLDQEVDPLISFADIVNTTRTTLAAILSFRERTWVDIEPVA